MLDACVCQAYFKMRTLILCILLFAQLTCGQTNRLGFCLSHDGKDSTNCNVVKDGVVQPQFDPTQETHYNTKTSAWSAWATIDNATVGDLPHTQKFIATASADTNVFSHQLMGLNYTLGGQETVVHGVANDVPGQTYWLFLYMNCLRKGSDVIEVKLDFEEEYNMATFGFLKLCEAPEVIGYMEYENWFYEKVLSDWKQSGGFLAIHESKGYANADNRTHTMSIEFMLAVLDSYEVVPLSIFDSTEDPALSIHWKNGVDTLNYTNTADIVLPELEVTIDCLMLNNTVGPKRGAAHFPALNISITLGTPWGDNSTLAWTFVCDWSDSPGPIPPDDDGIDIKYVYIGGGVFLVLALLFIYQSNKTPSTHQPVPSDQQYPAPYYQPPAQRSPQQQPVSWMNNQPQQPQGQQQRV